MSSPLLLGPLLFASCTKGFDDIVLTGTLYDGEESASAPVSGADLQIRNADGSKGEHTTTAYDGVFQIEITPEQSFTAVFSEAGSVETSFAATAGLGDIDAETRQLWLRSEDELADIATTFGDCGERGGASIEGVVHLYVPSVADYHYLPLVTSADVTALDDAGDVHMACYLDDEGVYDADAVETGLTGRFAIFGLPEGHATVRIGFVLGTEEMPQTVFPVWLSEAGTAPLYPALVQDGNY
jgi:hypothetical protein